MSCLLIESNMISTGDWLILSICENEISGKKSKSFKNNFIEMTLIILIYLSDLECFIVYLNSLNGGQYY